MENLSGHPVVVDHISVRYGQRIALDDVSLTLQRGSLVGLLGPNGAGKSTLLRAILGLTPVCAGEVRIFRQPSARARRHIAYVPQSELMRRDFPVSALDVVLMGRYRQRGWLRLLTREDRAEARVALQRVDMADLGDEPVAALSGGQRQRVLVARALAQQADIILLDEPLNGIDLPTQDLILTVARRLRSEGKTVVMATHDLGAAIETCDCFCCINRIVIALGSRGDVLQPDVLRQTYGVSLPVWSAANAGAYGSRAMSGAPAATGWRS